MATAGLFRNLSQLSASLSMSGKEITMRDHYDAQLWNEGHVETTAGIDRLLAHIMQAFCVLHRISWSAPWAEQQPCRR